MLNFVELTFKACKEIVASLNEADPVELFKEFDVGFGGDISIGADLIAERIFVKYLSSYGQIVSEESGIIGEGELKVIIDPLDGSDNFKSQFPYYGASVALVSEDETLCAVVCNFANGDFFYRCDDGVTCKNIYNPDINAPVLLRQNSAVGLFEKAYHNPNIVNFLKTNNLKFRSPGAVALSLAYAHYVKYVLFFGTMRDYDIVAGIHICKELYRYQDENCIIISKDKETFETLYKLVINKG
jgi:myo-inositol-1(or 4)-monophosphatase